MNQVDSQMGVLILNTLDILAKNYGSGTGMEISGTVYRDCAARDIHFTGELSYYRPNQNRVQMSINRNNLTPSNIQHQLAFKHNDKQIHRHYAVR